MLFLKLDSAFGNGYNLELVYIYIRLTGRGLSFFVMVSWIAHLSIENTQIIMFYMFSGVQLKNSSWN